MAHKGLWLHLEQSFERMILYRAHVADIFFPCHPYIWSTTVLHDKYKDTKHMQHATYAKLSGFVLYSND